MDCRLMNGVRICIDHELAIHSGMKMENCAINNALIYYGYPKG